MSVYQSKLIDVQLKAGSPWEFRMIVTRAFDEDGRVWVNYGGVTTSGAR